METQATPATTERSSTIPVEREVSVPQQQQQTTSVSPFALMRAMLDDMGKMRMATLDALWLPAIDLSMRDDWLVVHAELPGFNTKDLNVEVDGGTLTISGERRQSSGDAYHSERSYGSFYRAIPLPENVDLDQIEATFRNGVLEVTMPAPKAEQQGRRKIEVK
jgi:HSP20 family protein